MPNLETHSQALPQLAGGGALGALVGQVFGLDLIAMGCALLGAWIGLAFREARPDDLSKVALRVRFVSELLIVFIITVVTGFAMFWVRKLSAGAEYPLSFFFAFGTMIFRERILSGVGGIIDRMLGGFNFGRGGE